MSLVKLNERVPPAVVSFLPAHSLRSPLAIAIIAFFITYLELLIHGNCC